MCVRCLSQSGVPQIRFCNLVGSVELSLNAARTSSLQPPLTSFSSSCWGIDSRRALERSLAPEEAPSVDHNFELTKS